MWHQVVPRAVLYIAMPASHLFKSKMAHAAETTGEHVLAALGENTQAVLPCTMDHML